MQFAPLYPLLYKVLQPTFPSCLWTGSTQSPIIALTFDDGPHAHNTPHLLEVLKVHQVTASFFWLGVCVDRFPETARMVYQQGHWLGLHGYSHRAFPLLTPIELQQSLRKTQRAIAQALQIPEDDVVQRVRDVRPPLGVFTPKTLRDLRSWHYRPVMWSVVPEDWVCPGVEVVVKRVLQQVCNGSLIVLHDGYYGGTEVGAIAAALIPALKRQGYQFVTVDQLWQQRAHHQRDPASQHPSPLTQRHL